jgi:hypothetical protein
MHLVHSCSRSRGRGVYSAKMHWLPEPHKNNNLKKNNVFTISKKLTRVGHNSKKSHEGHLGVFFDPQKEIVITSELLGIFQPNFTGVSHIWSGIWKYVKFFFPRWRPTWPSKFWIECISALLSNTKTNKVSIHTKQRS